MAVKDRSPLIGQEWNKVTSAVVKNLEHDPELVDLKANIKDILGDGGNITVEMFRLAKDGSGTIESVSQYDLEDGTVSLDEEMLRVIGTDQGPQDPEDFKFRFGNLVGAGVQTQDGVKSLILFQNLGGNDKTVFRLTKR